MSKHAPWTDKEVEQAATYYQAKIINELAYHNALTHAGLAFLAGATWAAEQIEKCETIYYRDRDLEDRVIVASPEQFELDTHQAKLVGVREVEK